MISTETYFGKGSTILAQNCCVVRDRLGRIFVYGRPTNEDHSCDKMGCASVGDHIIAYCGKRIGEIDDKTAIEDMYRQACNTIQECVQKHKLGMGGENIFELVAKEIDLRTVTYYEAEAARVFIEHIRHHLKPNENVICKICNKTVEEIWHLYCEDCTQQQIKNRMGGDK